MNRNSLYPNQVIYKKRIYHFKALNWANGKRLFALRVSPQELYQMVQRGDASYQVYVRTGIIFRRKHDKKEIRRWFFT